MNWHRLKRSPAKGWGKIKVRCRTISLHASKWKIGKEAEE